MKTPGRSKRSGGRDFGCVRFTVRGGPEFKCYAPPRYAGNELGVHYDIVKACESKCREMVGIQGKCLAICKRCTSSIELPPGLFTKSNGKLEFLPGKRQVLKDYIHKEVERVSESHRKYHVVEGDAAHQGSALTKSPAECSSMPAPSLRQGPDKFQQTMNELKKLLGACAHCDLLAVLEEEHKAIAHELEDLKKMQSVTEGLQSAPKNTGTRTLDAQLIFPQLQDPHSGEEAGFLGGTCADEIPPAPLPKPSASNGPEDDSWNNRRSCQPRSSDFGAMEDSVPAEGCLNSQSPKVLAEVPECYPSPNTLMQTEDQFQDGPSGEELDSGVVSQESSAGGCQAWITSNGAFIQANDSFQNMLCFGDPMNVDNTRDALMQTRQSTEKVMGLPDDHISDYWVQFLSTFIYSDVE
ncbi:uncharacterized protein [Physcomitrium patens]|uniref:Uncharacterized protein n=1 Tax=Physcomitrium patens TaxID=3218 RepID=A0A7I4E4U2_PHYPA|nr:uncharacterized protein LOC112284311 isoform X2 [Physcomitrium patens]|eukprot:XP_024379780.1 uncharacterized protein LOC112284311 isoform X2 [Physcomitrella patens]